ncbi:MAG TPA: roadblock/LC7 domain-containing protein [Gemmatimonadales bacterium]
MQPLRSVLMALAERADVAAAVVVSDDGLVVESSLPAGLDAEELAALATGAARTLAALSCAAKQGDLQQAVTESSGGTFILQRLPSGANLLVLASADGDLGTLLYDLRRHMPALVPLL